VSTRNLTSVRSSSLGTRVARDSSRVFSWTGGDGEPVETHRGDPAQREGEQGRDLGRDPRFSEPDPGPVGEGDKTPEHEQPDHERQQRGRKSLHEQEPADADEWKRPDAAQPLRFVLLALETDQERQRQGEHEAHELGREVLDQRVHRFMLPPTDLGVEGSPFSQYPEREVGSSEPMDLMAVWIGSNEGVAGNGNGYGYGSG